LTPAPSGTPESRGPDSRPALHVFVPGPIDQRTGGYLYDARIVAGLEFRGWRLEVHELDGTWPEPDVAALGAFRARIDAVPEGARIVIDGLAGSAHPELLEAAGRRDDTVMLVHHPLGDETGLDAGRQARLLELERRALAAVAGVIVTSPFTAHRLGDLGVAASRVRVVVPGTEAPPKRGPRPTVEPGVPVLLSVGSVTPRKGHDLLVEALARVADRPWLCVIAGGLDRDKAQTARVRERITALGLDARVRLLGEVDEPDLAAWLGAADAFALPSWYEGYGMAYTEALLAGLPVVGTTAGAIPHTVPAEAAWLVEPGDVDALTAALAELLDAPQVRAEKARAARAWAARLPSWADQATAFESALDELLAPSPHRAALDAHSDLDAGARTPPPTHDDL
jgi:glycosyltransferase involved in cell wall biosynthesis